MKVITIGLIGLPGSGKTTAIDAIKDLGTVLSMGDVVRNEAKKREVSLNDENLGNIAKELREKNGPGIIAERCVEVIKHQKERVIIVDGVRSFAEVKVFRKYWKFPIIAIVVSEENRFKWLFERGRSDDPRTIDDLKERDSREIQFGLNEVIEKADFIIENCSSIEDLKKKTRNVVLDIIKSS